MPDVYSDDEIKAFIRLSGVSVSDSDLDSLVAATRKILRARMGEGPALAFGVEPTGHLRLKPSAPGRAPGLQLPD